MPVLYEISTRSWIRNAGLSSIAEISQAYWQKLRSSGVDYIWLMGVWDTSQSSIDKYCFHPDLIREYSAANPTWQKSDVGGSPYAIEAYQTSHLVGSNEDLLKCKEAINKVGMKLILDFVPNHLNAETSLIRTHPEIFFKRPSEEAKHLGLPFFSTPYGSFAHGRDPYFDPWTDTIQLNYFNPGTHEFMLDILTQISKYCDGVRCDMAMLILPDIFTQTWGHLSNNTQQVGNFWQKAIPTIKAADPSFLFIAEAYWETEWRLQQDGFDYTYDKRMLDLLVHHDLNGLINHLSADQEFQEKMVRFIENHDEPRSLSSLGAVPSQAAAVIIATIPGLTFYFDGQWEGARKKVPVQLVKAADDVCCPCTIAKKDSSDAPSIRCICQNLHYQALLNTVNRDVFRKGVWKFINEPTLNGILSWTWTLDDEVAMVFVNYSKENRTGIIHFDQGGKQIKSIYDILNNEREPTYFVNLEKGRWQVQLPAFKSIIISFDFTNQN